MFKKIFIIFAFVATCQSATFKITRTRCPDVTPIKFLDAMKYIGQWYQAAAIPSYFNPSGSRCARATYETLTKDAISVHNVGTLPNGKFTEAYGNATFSKNVHDGELTVYFQRDGNTVGGDYFVLNTNYTDYASVYSCSKSDDGTITEFGWVLTRHRDYSDELVRTGLKDFSNLEVDTNKFEQTFQGDTCVYERNAGQVKMSNFLMTLLPLIFALLAKNY